MGKQTENMMHGSHFVGRWEWDHIGKYHHIQMTREAYDVGLSLASAAEAKRSALSSSGLLTANGLKAEMATWLAKEGAPGLASIDRKIKMANSKISEVAARKLQPIKSEADKQDVAAAMLRSETRAFIRGLDPAKRTALLNDPEIDPMIMDAITEAPAALSGVMPSQLAGLKERQAAALNPEVAAHLAASSDAVEVAMNARRAAVKEIAKATGISEGEVERAALLASGEKPTSIFENME